MVTSSGIPVIAGLTIGIGFLVLFSVLFRPTSVLSDSKLLSSYSELAEVKYFFDKYPDAKRK